LYQILDRGILNRKTFIYGKFDIMNQLKQQALENDHQDPLGHKRADFHLPLTPSGDPYVYFCGNSLGLQPKNVANYIQQELNDWKNLGVEGHFHAKNPWMPYHEFLTEQMADVVGAKPIETVVMNSLTVNLHLLMVSFYRPSPERYKILIEKNAFPSDQYAVKSQLKFHGFSPDDALLELPPSEGKAYTETQDIMDFLDKHGNEIALVLIGGVNYYSGQYFPMKEITEKAHKMGAVVGFDLAHAAGNIDLKLHDTNADFAAWCSYKYLNSGPGGLSGIFVHERHAHDFELPRFAGWWGHDKQSRFKMPPDFIPEAGAEGWQMSNPPILAMAALRASLEHFAEVGMSALRQKSLRLTSFLERCLHEVLSDKVQIITPTDSKHRGCQLSLRIKDGDKKVFERLTAKDVIADWREPDVIRVAPVPMYNSFMDAYEFAARLKEALEEE